MPPFAPVRDGYSVEHDAGFIGQKPEDMFSGRLKWTARVVSGMRGTPRIAACQFEPVVDDAAENFGAIEQALTSLPSSVAVAVFPELCVTGYALDVAEECAEPIPGPMTDRLISLAADHQLTVVAGVPEQDGDVLYNSLVAVDGDGVQATYRKQRSWSEETETFSLGDGPTLFETRVGTVGLAVCYDLNFPELALKYAREGCDVLAVAAAWRTSFESDWRLLLRARALDGPFYVAGSNHLGDQRVVGQVGIEGAAGGLHHRVPDEAGPEAVADLHQGVGARPAPGPHGRSSTYQALDSLLSVPDGVRHHPPRTQRTDACRPRNLGELPPGRGGCRDDAPVQASMASCVGTSVALMSTASGRESDLGRISR